MMVLLTLASPGDDEVSVPGVAAVLVKQHGAGARDGALEHINIALTKCIMIIQKS